MSQYGQWTCHFVIASLLSLPVTGTANVDGELPPLSTAKTRQPPGLTCCPQAVARLVLEHRDGVGARAQGRRW